MSSILRFAFRRAVVPAAALLTLAACEPQLDSVEPSAGSVNFSRYVAVGDDHTAGVQNGGLTRASQEASFANLIARQLRLVGGGDFVQPLFDASSAGSGYLVATGLTDSGQPLLRRVSSNRALIDSLVLSPGDPCQVVRYQYAPASTSGAVQNLGVPGLRLADVRTAGLGSECTYQDAAQSYNAYFRRLQPNAAAGCAKTYLNYVSAANPTFFTLQAGLGDVLAYLQQPANCRTLPTATALTSQLQALVDSLTKNNATGALITLPALSSLPLTSTKGRALPALLSVDSATVFYVEATPTARPLAAGDVVLSTVLGRLGRNETAEGQSAAAALGLSADNPIPAQYVLTESNARKLDGVLSAVNEKMYALAASKSSPLLSQLAYVDGSTLYLQLGQKGALVDGVRYTPNPATGNFYSLDGYSLTPRGNALLANAVLQALNNKFGSHIPQLDASQFSAVPLP